MSISLTTASGDAVSSFGAGNTTFSQGAATNTAAFGQQDLFGPRLNSSGQSVTTPGTTTPTAPGSTKSLNYINLAPVKSVSAPHVGPMEAKTTLDLPTSSGAKLTGASNEAELRDRRTGRNSEFGYGTTEARTGSNVPGGLSGDVADDAEKEL